MAFIENFLKEEPLSGMYEEGVKNLNKIYEKFDKQDKKKQDLDLATVKSYASDNNEKTLYEQYKRQHSHKNVSSKSIARQHYAKLKDHEIYLRNVHTGETFHEIFKVKGKYSVRVLGKFMHFMRDHRENKAIWTDPKLLDILYAINQETGNKRPFYVLSGYRTKKTNNMLRKKGHGVATHSLHMKAKAVDITSRHLSVKRIAGVARSLKKGGVGQYNNSHFVHLDTGRVRKWWG